MKRVLIIQRVLPHYRVPFFEQLRKRLAADGIELDLVVGQPTKAGAAKRDQASLPWAAEVTNRYARAGRGRHLVWQPAWRMSRHADLVIVEQASRLLINYLLLATRRFGGPAVAFWGHGENLDRASASRFGEFVKRSLARRADWWFCYTKGTARLVEEMGVDGRRMTVVQNATDTAGLQVLRAAVSEDETVSVRELYGMHDGAAAVSLGSLYPNKRPQFLVAAGDQMHRLDSRFQLLVIGDGPDRAVIETAAITRPWLHYAGARTGADLAQHASVGQIMLNPGLIGLGVLDAFALALPVVTCELDYHSPEIEYLEHGVNGLVLPASTTPEQYAVEVTALMNDVERLRLMVVSCRDAARRYTVEVMTANFATGVHTALAKTGESGG
jgi:glycosyltransferase involved in cell wall biosynthesis